MLVSTPATSRAATTNDAFGITSTFDNENDPYEHSAIKTNAVFTIQIKNSEELGSDFQLSADFYIPLQLFENDDSSLWVSFSPNIRREAENNFTTVGVYDLGMYRLEKEHGKIIGDYVVINLTTTMERSVFRVYDGADRKAIKYIPNPEDYCDNITGILYSSNIAKKATIYIDNLKFTSGFNTLLDTDFSDLTNVEYLGYGSPDENGTKLEITKPSIFEPTLLELSTKSVNIKVGEAVIVPSITVPTESVTFKSNKKKLQK